MELHVNKWHALVSEHSLMLGVGEAMCFAIGFSFMEMVQYDVKME